MATGSICTRSQTGEADRAETAATPRNVRQAGNGWGTALLSALLAVGLAVPADGYARSHGQAAKAHAPHPQAAAKPQPEKPQAEPPKQGQQDRVPFTPAETANAWPEGLPGALRIQGDDVGAFAKLVGAASAAADPWLVLSGGGENGAYAAGILNGWSEAGDRPVFGVITGVSTGALIAPFAFVGPAADPMLKKNYTEISAADVFEFGGTGAALTDTWPLKERIDKSVRSDLMRAIAAEHAKGRRLLIATTQVDTERPVLWDMGAIATLAAKGDKNTDKAIRLFREVMLASTAVPGVFPPVMIDALSEQGKAFQEMHNDGGAMTPFFLAPAAAIEGMESLRMPAHTIYLVVNNRLTPEFGQVPRTVLGVLGGTMSAAIKAQTSAALALTKSYAARAGLDLRVAEIDGRFTKSSPGPFDEGYMQALFAHGEALGRAGTAFASAGPKSPASGPEVGPTSGDSPRREGTAMPADRDGSLARR